MTQTPGPTAGPTNHTPTNGLDRFFGWIRSVDLRRDGDNKWLAGVCSGIARRLGVDPIVIRAALVLLVVLGGVGITVYLIAWAFLPNNREDIIAEKALRDGDVLGIILLVVIGLSLIGGTGIAGDSSGIGWIWWVVVPVGLVVWLVTRNRDGRGKNHAPGQPGPYGAQPNPYGAQPTPYGAQPTPYGAQPGSTWPATSATTPPFAPGRAPGAAVPGTQGPEVQGFASQPPSAPSPVPQAQEYAAMSTTTYASAPAATPPGGVYGPPPTPAAPRPRPPKVPRRRSGGFVSILLVGGLALAAYGGTISLHDAANWAGSGQTVALAAALGILGLGTLVLGLLGRRAGFTGFMAIVLALVTWTASVVPDLTFGGGIGERTWRPSATDTSARYRLGIGSGVLDLANAPNNPGTARAIEARVGMGELKIWIPQNLTVEVHSSVGAGNISRMANANLGPGAPLGVDNNGDPIQLSGSDGHNISTVETFGTGAPDVVVDAHVGFGQILIGKE